MKDSKKNLTIKDIPIVTSIEHENRSFVTVTNYLILDNLDFSTHVQQNNNYRTHNHVSYEIFYILSGELKHTLNGKEENISTGDCFILSPTDVHSFSSVTPNKNRDIIISVEFFENVLSLFPNSQDLIKNKISGAHIKFNINELAEIENMFREFSFERELNKKRCISVSILMIIFGKIFSGANEETNIYKIPPIVKKICDKLNTAPYIKKGAVGIFKSMNYNKSYICHTFKRYMGITISDYVKQIRLNHIAYYLKTSDYSLRQIADMVGLETVSYMNKIFKEKYLVTPTQYRKHQY